jgi:nucleoside diphosphate kinase
MFSIVIIKPDAYSKRNQILKYFENYQYEILADPIILTKKKEVR